MAWKAMPRSTGFQPVEPAAHPRRPSRHGQLPISTMGGLKSRGHPVGATGIYQIVELVQQLTGQAGANQVPNARIGMAQNIGGSGATIVTHLLAT
jgi:acetyl-CoA C-acetyltransferase